MPCTLFAARSLRPLLLAASLLVASAGAAAPALVLSGRAIAQPARLDARALAEIERFEGRWRATRAATYRMIKRERMRDGEVVHEEVLVKLRRPGQVYMKRLKPREGQEVLYDAGRDAGKLIAHPGHFPDLTLRLDIHGRLATRGQHHTVDDAGYQQVLDILRQGLARARKAPHGERLLHLGQRQIFGREAAGVELRAGHAKGKRVRAREDESLFQLAERTGMDAYVLYTANPSIDDLTDELDEDESYLVPAYYGYRTQIWFDTATALPLKVTIWDKKGRVYEHYEHHDLEVDVALGDRDFSEDNPAYDF